MNRSLGFASLLALSALTACPSSEPRVEFAALEAGERDIVVEAATGGLVEQAALSVFALEFFRGGEETCPTRTVSGDTIVYESSGCTDSSGVKYSGRAEMVNLDLGSDGVTFDPAKAGKLVFVDFQAGEQLFDGEVSRSISRDREPYVMNVDLQATIGPQISVSLEADCDEDGCTTRGGSSGELIGVGVFDIKETQVEDAASGEQRFVIELIGEDVVRVAEADRDENGCIAYTIDGAAGGTVCEE